MKKLAVALVVGATALTAGCGAMEDEPVVHTETGPRSVDADEVTAYLQDGRAIPCIVVDIDHGEQDATLGLDCDWHSEVEQWQE